MPRRIVIFAGAVSVALSATSSLAQNPDRQTELRGLAFARAQCAGCHAVELFGDSPLPIAPPFRTLHERYPVEHLEEALAEGIATGHQNMPQFQLFPDQIDDLIAYLKSLERTTN